LPAEVRQLGAHLVLEGSVLWGLCQINPGGIRLGLCGPLHRNVAALDTDHRRVNATFAKQQPERLANGVLGNLIAHDDLLECFGLDGELGVGRLAFRVCET
jgi:hypothetical protein